MLMTAAGTRAPIAMVANANPANQLGNRVWKSAGTTSFALAILRCAAWLI
jgi:hypothetical protein